MILLILIYFNIIYPIKLIFCWMHVIMFGSNSRFVSIGIFHGCFKVYNKNVHVERLIYWIVYWLTLYTELLVFFSNSWKFHKVECLSASLLHTCMPRRFQWEFTQPKFHPSPKHFQKQYMMHLYLVNLSFLYITFIYCRTI